MSVSSNLKSFQQYLEGTKCRLIAVSKTKPESAILEAYGLGFKRFGENRVQELKEKYHSLPKDIEWHMIGHLQTNKVKVIAPFINMIHGVDSIKLADEIDKQAFGNNRIIPCLLQVHIAKEQSKFGFDPDELIELVKAGEFAAFSQVKFCGLMGMATFTSDMDQIRIEYQKLKQVFDEIKVLKTTPNFDFNELSMGMSNDYKIAIEQGSTLIRIGSDIFGARN